MTKELVLILITIAVILGILCIVRSIFYLMENKIVLIEERLNELLNEALDIVPLVIAEIDDNLLVGNKLLTQRANTFKYRWDLHYKLNSIEKISNSFRQIKEGNKMVDHQVKKYRKIYNKIHSLISIHDSFVNKYQKLKNFNLIAPFSKLLKIEEKAVFF